MKKVLIVDGNAILHRAFHAMPEWRNGNGEATSGVYGFFSMLLKAREDLDPTHLVVAFDMPEPNFRHAMYVGYQANRGKDEQLDRDIWEQVERLKIALDKLSVPVFTAAGYEADDVIGTICEQIERVEGVTGIVLTGDRDLLQLVSDKIKVFMPVKGLSEAKLLDRDGVKEKMGVWPEQIVDYKGLTGDPSDGYPGVAGIGPKTAVELLGERGTLDDVYVKVRDPKLPIRKSVTEKLLQGYEMAKMSQKLAQIIKDAPVKFVLDEATMPTRETMAAFFEEVGHPSLRARVLGKEGVEKLPEATKNRRADLKLNSGQESLF